MTPKSMLLYNSIPIKCGARPSELYLIQVLFAAVWPLIALNILGPLRIVISQLL